MKRIAFALLSALFLTGVSISAQQQPPTKPAAKPTEAAKPADAAKEVTYYGCLVPASKPGTFMLLGVGIKGQKHDDNVSYNIEAPEKLDVVHFQTMEVEIVGTLVQNGTAKVLKATKISRKSDYCG